MKNIRHYKENVKRQVLIVASDSNDQKALGIILSNEYEPVYANDGQEALDILRGSHHNISLVLLDVDIDKIDGYELLAILADDEALLRIPVIVLTSDKNVEIKCLHLGAQDFIVKPYNIPELILMRVRRSILVAEETDIISRTEKDTLTGLTTKRYFYEYINEFDNYNPDVKMDAIAINIKRFHTINDMFGRKFGDRILVKVAKSLKQLMEQYEGLASRVESDTFYVYIASRDDYKEIIFKALDEVSFNLNKDFHIDFKVGIYHNVDKSQSIEKRFDDALRALRQNDDSLSNTLVVYNRKMHEKEIFEERLVLEFDKSIEEKQFTFYLQPKIDVSRSVYRLSSAEALVRWVHPVYGIISPGVFIPLFERNGLIQKLDFYIWNEAAAQVRKWKEEYHADVPISINVSRVDLFNEHLVDELLAIVKRNNISVHELILEVTESAVVSDTSVMMENVKKLKENGFIIEMDDFGTGYSSLHMVSSLPIDALKIDMSFIKNIMTSSKDKRMVEIILQIAKLLKAKTIAEGVETINQVNALRRMGVDIIQGYHFSPPLPIDEFNEKYIINKFEK